MRPAAAAGPTAPAMCDRKHTYAHDNAQTPHHRFALSRPQVPGTYFDALNRNTKLGKAVAAAVDELEHLNDMVRCQRGLAACCVRAL